MSTHISELTQWARFLAVDWLHGWLLWIWFRLPGRPLHRASERCFSVYLLRRLSYRWRKSCLRMAVKEFGPCRVTFDDVEIGPAEQATLRKET